MSFEIRGRITGVAVINGHNFYSPNGLRLSGDRVSDYATGERLTGHLIPHPERGQHIVQRGGRTWVNGVLIDPEDYR